jgi:hypothetical protein
MFSLEVLSRCGRSASVKPLGALGGCTGLKENIVGVWQEGARVWQEWPNEE